MLIRDELLDNLVAPALDLGLEVLFPRVGQQLCDVSLGCDSLQDVAEVEFHIDARRLGGVDQAHHDAVPKVVEHNTVAFLN